MSDARSLFDGLAEEYDRGCLRTVPDPEGLYGAVVRSLPFRPDRELRVLDLGAGTGLLSAKVAERFPEARITLVDLSVRMLDVARRRFAHSPGRFVFRVLDYVREPLPGGPSGFEVVVSALSLHHLAHGDKQKTFGKVHASLAGGGRFVNADRVRTEKPPGVSHDHEHDGPHAVEVATLKEQIGWLREAGFEEVECRYESGPENNRFAVYGGRKS
ncbi:Methyltransferase domain [Rubrobacter radiotolerans]|uniref:Class I SAM-dependent methyltransferase n=1 Tax=Rubrobacter radiotolerans TaxID=42256 RepID=A0A023WYX0_RUBRA|nr:class I SAM-dependent methyltransferase [Rubrobacter radiotolerans]AHY45422.1 Methyltransferase domain [Rubrobacter radiotolerans]MDX5892833.1 class I SAM-dependent methyltransferase [Rubrobacter radiotolerans]SMC02587.1 Methyltransferase domain-containing protein [Rubrobacter radiotolerans DSM 5868]